MTATDPRALIAEGREHDEAMTSGYAVAGLYRSDDLDEQVAQFRDAHVRYAGQPMHVVAVATSDKPIEVDATCFATTGNGPHGAVDAAGIAWLRTNLRALLDGYAAALDEVERLKQRDLFGRDCEWFVATSPEPWLKGRPDFPRCENRANCVGETPGRRSQYILCREHAEQWDGSLVAMSGEPVAFPRQLRESHAAEVERLRAWPTWADVIAEQYQPPDTVSVREFVEWLDSNLIIARDNVASVTAALAAALAEVERLRASQPSWSHTEALQQRDALIAASVESQGEIRRLRARAATALQMAANSGGPCCQGCGTSWLDHGDTCSASGSPR